MKLYFKEKSFSMNDNTLCLADAEGNLVYDWKSTTLLTKKIRIFDAEKNEVAVVKQVFKSLLPKYQIFIRDEMVLEVKKEFHLLLPKYSLSGMDWEMENKWMLFDYGVKKGEEQMLNVTLSDDAIDWQSRVYEVDIPDAHNELLAATLAIAINCGIEGEKFMQKQTNR